MTKQRRSKQDKIRERSDEVFIGRKEPIFLFEQHLKCSSPDDTGFIDILNISGDGGMGKTYLSKKLKGIADARKKTLTAYSDEGVKSVMDWMHEVAGQFKKKNSPLKSFSEHYEKYLKEKQLLEADETAPKGWANFLGKTLVKGGLQLTKGVPVLEGIAEMVDKDAAGEQGGEIADYFYRRVKGKKVDELKLVLQPLLELTPKFLNDLWEYEEDGYYLCFFIDTYEETSPFLDEWLRELWEGIYGEVPLNLTLVISGRDKLDTNLWSAFLSVTKHFSLEPFTNEEAQAFLSERGITNPAVIDTILEISEKLPIILAMLADEAPISPESVKDHSGDAVTRFLKWIKDPTERDLALNAAIPRQLNLDIVKAILPENADATALFDWLCKRSFVHIRGGHWAYHPVVRKLMLRYLYKLSQDDWEKQHYKLASHYEQKATMLGIETSMKQYKEPTWRAHCLEKSYHKLSASPLKEISGVMDDFSASIFEGEFEDFLIWAETIFQAEEIPASSEWGKLFREIHSHTQLKDFTKLLPLLNKVNASEIVNQCKYSLKWRNLEAITFNEFSLKLRKEHRLDEAIKQLQNAIELNSENVFGFLNNLGVTFGDKGQVNEAIIQYTKAIELKPDFEVAYNNLGIALKEQGRLDEAIEQYRKCIEVKPDYHFAYNNLGIALKEQGKLDEAIEQYRKCIEVKPDYHFAYFNLGNALAEQGKLDEAIEQYRKCIEVKPDYHSSYNKLGIALKEQGRLDEAIEQYRKCIEVKPDYHFAYFNLGNALEEQGKLDEAIEQYRKSIGVKPDYHFAYINLSIALKEQGKLDEAIEQYRKCIEVKPDYHFAYFNLGNALAEQGKLDEAIEQYRKCIEVKPDYHSSYNKLGIALKEQGKLDEAIEQYRKCIEVKPDYHFAYFNLGNALKEQGKLDGAVEQYRKCIEAKPDYHFAYINLGHDLEEQGKLDEAIEQYRKCIEVKPDYHFAYNKLGNALEEQGKLDEAIEQYRKCIEVKPDYHFAYNNLGNALEEQGKLDDAIEQYRKCIEVMPDFHFAYFNLGNALKEQGKLDEAIEQYQIAINKKTDYIDAYRELGFTFFMMSKIDESIQAFEDGSKYETEGFNFRINVAFLKLRQGKADESRLLSKSIWEDSEMKESFSAKNLGHYHLIKKEFDKALEWYRISQPLWDCMEENLFDHLESDYDNLIMKSFGITRDQYDSIIAQLKFSEQ